ncbi:hypothetical protein C0Q70_16984 [Pomacea canaliculata]|uniref:Cerebral cavernous malformations 2 harmonin-homology domain-containing protein n=1 Tax=Pomacea canaliculata TaxID=400727 RepID=A0A2T7NRB2_POMCA|nr:cerebral cavernous malformations 2 protein-like [Pomacea canaliculata]PVD23711.1 hypothetical protein C0Q70_16984 [Pomacea canaliculata]
MEDKRRGKAQSPQQWPGGGRQEVDMFDREARPHSMARITQPDYHFTSQHLADDPVEKHVLFAGVIDDVSATMDITNRTDVLRVIDKGKKLGVIPMHVTYDHSAIMSLSLHNIKIMKHNSNEDLLLRIPMHEIAAICYIKDDKQHILAIKFGTPEVCQLAVLYCDSKPVAEELCALVGQCFRLIYTEAMIEILNSSIDPTGIPSTGGSTTIPNNAASDSVNGSDSKSIRGGVPSEGGSTTSFSAEELLKDYMKKLHKELDASELKIFAQALQDLDSRFQDFCERVLQLYGADRKHLLAEMLPFIPADNLPYFEDFLAQNGILLPESTSTLSSYRSNIRNYPTRRSIGEVSTTSSISNNPTSDEALHQLLELTESQYDSVVVDTDPNKYVPSADY